MQDEDFESIMKSITSKLTGDIEKDMSYLLEQSNKYKNHKYGKEVTRACGRLLYEIMPDNMKKEFDAAVNKDVKAFDAAFEEVQFQMYKKKYGKALELLESMIYHYEELDLYDEDEVSCYFDFKEPFEEILYMQIYDPQKEIRRAQIKYSDLYCLYGSLLLELNRYEEAEWALRKGMKWNPINAKIAFEHAETYKVRGMFDEFYNATKDIYKIAFHSDYLARYYRNLGYYFIEKNEMQLAVYCYLFSLNFEESERVQSEIYYISQMDRTINLDINLDMIQNAFTTHGIPFGPDHNIIGMAYELTKLSIEDDNKENAKYYLSIILEFYENEELLSLKSLIEKM